MSPSPFSKKDSREFGILRGFFWPIHAWEAKKFLPLGILMFCTVFIYTVLHDTKDTLIITASSSGAALIPFLKVFITMPVAILFVVVYSKLSNFISQERLFYGITLSFLGILGLFAFWMHPNKELLHPDPHWIKSLQQAYPRLQHIFAMMELWSFALFYLISELWGAVVVTLLFWQFANEVTRTREAKRFYSFFGLIANFSLIFAGLASKHMADIRGCYPAGVDIWVISIQHIVVMLVSVGVLMVVLYRWMHVNVLNDPKYYDCSLNEGLHHSKASSPPLRQSMKVIFKSRYLGYIALLIIGYNFSNNLLDVVWKSQLKIQYPDPNDYCMYMGNFTMIMGFCTMGMVVFFKGIVRKLGWFAGAIVSPAFMLLAAIPFFGVVCFQDAFLGVSSFFVCTPLMLAIGLGAFQEITSKGSKYALFDPTKEMAYMPLTKELRIKGKAFVDVAGSKIGKALSGFMAGALLMTTGAPNISQATPFFAICVFVMIGIWMVAVWKLNKLYKEKQLQHEQQEAQIPITPIAVVTKQAPKKTMQKVA
ncbi:MAG: Npt1/Npt2 family nucleotide transporter [Pseudomonadota bacterium]